MDWLLSLSWWQYIIIYLLIGILFGKLTFHMEVNVNEKHQTAIVTTIFWPIQLIAVLVSIIFVLPILIVKWFGRLEVNMEITINFQWLYDLWYWLSKQSPGYIALYYSIFHVVIGLIVAKIVYHKSKSSFIREDEAMMSLVFWPFLMAYVIMCVLTKPFVWFIKWGAK